MERPRPLIVLLSVILLAATSALAWFGPGGRSTSTMLAGQTIDASRVELYNTKGSFNVEATTRDGWLISASHTDKRR